MLTSAQNIEVRVYPSVDGMDSGHSIGDADVTDNSPSCMKVIGDLHIMKTLSIRNTSSRRRITGQGMTEYIIVLALVALAAVVAVGFFGDTVQSQFAAMGQKLTGNSGAAAVGEGKTAADNAVLTITPQETLSTYAN